MRRKPHTDVIQLINEHNDAKIPDHEFFLHLGYNAAMGCTVSITYIKHAIKSEFDFVPHYVQDREAL